MYLALKWLLFLGIAMWALLCCIDYQVNKNSSQGPHVQTYSETYKNKIQKEKARTGNHQRQSLVFLNYLTFIAGALAVTLYNKKTEICDYSCQLVKNIKYRANSSKVIFRFKKTTASIRDTLLKKIEPLWENIKDRVSKTKINFMQSEDESRKQRNLLLLKRLREVGLERNKLAELLVIAVQENKNIKLKCYLENLAKKRLMQQIQESQKQIKENRSKYVNFYQLHLVTSQENLFLKNRLKKVTKEKEEVEANLMKLITKVYQSPDNNLKAYCTCFIVKTKENIFGNNNHADISTSEQQHHSLESFNNKELNNENDNLYSTNSLPGTSLNEMSQETEYFHSFSTKGPKSKLRSESLKPGEYVWTIKDKNGIIEKLYEYDFGYNYDNGDAIRRIREYSVYHDSDCLLDIAGTRSSTTIIRNSRPSATVITGSSGISSLTMPHRKFLTGSPVFQQFLKTNSNIPGIFPATTAPSPSLLCS